MHDQQRFFLFSFLMFVVLGRRQWGQIEVWHLFRSQRFWFRFQVGKMNEAMYSINDYTVVSHELQTFKWFCQILRYDKVFCKSIVYNIKFKCGCW